MQIPPTLNQVSLFFGEIKDNNTILFIIDCSYTMSQQKFTIGNILVSRKDALAQDLIKCLKTLRNDQNFNVLKFNLKCVSYSNTCVQATPINIEKAV